MGDVLPVCVETFKSRLLSSWPLLANTSLPDQLTGDVTTIGYDNQQSKLAISHKDITTYHFMKAHVENNSKQGDQDVPLFPITSCSWTRRLKLRQVLESTDVEKALATVSSHAVQGKKAGEDGEGAEEATKTGQRKLTTSVPSDQQQPPQLQDYCPTGTYISMVITYPAEVVNFQVVRPDPEPELEDLQRVSIGIDDNNFLKIFPRLHVEFLDYILP